MLFLSYAREDSQTGREVAGWFNDHGFGCYVWEDPQRNSRFIERIENDINSADAFFALLSPDFLASPWCRFERELALQRDIDLRDSDPGRSFLNVLSIAETPRLAAGFLSSYGAIDLTNRGNRDSLLSALVARLGLPPSQAADAETVSPRPAITLFRNRDDELQKVKNGLTNASGPHFWLLNAPPELGKTWFLGRLSAEVMIAQPDRWITRMVDLRDYSADVLADAGEILACLRFPPVPTDEPQTPQNVARMISREGKSYLCLLDSAELLTRKTASALRHQLHQIYDYLRLAGNINVRLAVVVASRRDDTWRGVAPQRLSSLSLSEFSVNVTEDALITMASLMERSLGQALLRSHGLLTHQLSEGLPALLVRCLQWIRSEEWLELDRLSGREVFKKIAEPYIKQRLLSSESLMPGVENPPPVGPAALDKALRALVRYRFITQSHLRHHLDNDADLRRDADYLEWTPEELWSRISRTALLKRPLNEPWEEIHDAIRRLLFKYYYPTTEEQVTAHRDAGAFAQVWADRQTGTEQVVGILDCLWHQAEVLRLTGSDEMASALNASAGKFARNIQGSAAYTKGELRKFAVDRMLDDEEFQESIRKAGNLIDDLEDIFTTAQDS